METHEIGPRLTSPARSSAEAGTEQVDRSVAIGPVLIVLLAAGLLLRVVIAAFIVPGSGFRVDVNDFAVWANDLVATGPGGFYREGYFVDYPPGYLYVLWLMGAVGGAVGGLIGRPELVSDLVKIPGILADVGVAALLFVLGRRFFGEWIGIAAAALFLFNPGVIFDSAVWGQVDSVGTLVLLATFYVLSRGWTEAAAALAVVATLVKFQYGFVIPIVLLVGLKRHLAGRSSAAEFDGARDPLRVLSSAAAGLVTLIAMMFPFRLALYAPADETHSLVHRFFEAAGTYTGLTINAFNLWMNPWTDLATTGQWGDDRQTLLQIGSFAVTAQLASTVLFLAVVVIALRALWKRDDAAGVLFVALVLAVAFFVVPTRVHERYLFPALALAAPLAIRGWGWRALYGTLTASFFFNIYYAYTIEYFENPGVTRDPFLGATVLSPLGIYVLSFASVVALAVLVVIAFRPWRIPWGRVEPSVESERLAWSAAPAPLAADHSPAGTERGGGVSAEPDIGPEPGAAGIGEGIRRPRFWWLRREPSDPLYAEPPRRLALPDGVLFAIIVVLALVFRLGRLDAPVSMHFDEVYHARSATEWLANWQYDVNRDVYEWTHPMLAKYLIAAGIVAADPNRVVREQELDEPVTLLAAAPARSSIGRERSLLFAVQGEDMVVRDAQNYQELDRWRLDEPPGALVYDDAYERLLVGSATDGDVTSYDVSAVLRSAQTDDAGPPAVTLDSGLETVAQIELVGGSPHVAARGGSEVAVLDPTTDQVLATRRIRVGGIAYLPAAGTVPAAIVATDPAARTVRYLDPATLADQSAAKEAPAEGTGGETTGEEGTTEAPTDEPTEGESAESQTAEARCPRSFAERDAGDDMCFREAVELPSRPIGPLEVQGDGEEQRIYVPVEAVDGEGGAFSVVFGTVRPESEQLEATIPLPAEARDVLWNRVTNIVYVIGPDRVWAVEPHGDDRSGFAIFDTTELPGEPVAFALDASSNSPRDDNEHLIVSAAVADTSAKLVWIDTGSTAFAWRFAGVIFGALLAGLVFLLAATMFQRRGVAVLAGLFVGFDALSFAQSRISMNDIFVAVFITAAYLLFWQVWSGRWARSAWWALPTVGALIGLAAATKWVGFYALAGLLVLVLARSDLGRLVLLVGLTFALVVFGIGAPLPFFLVLLGAVLLLVALAWAKPVKIDSADLRALPATGMVVGLVGFVFAWSAGSLDRGDPVGLVVQLLARGAEAGWPVAVMVGVAGLLIAARAFRSLRDPSSDARWYLPSEMGGFSWPWAGASLVVVSLLVYALSYVPYLQLGHEWSGTASLGPGYGWSLEELHVQMFSYHFGLTAPHPASSPWWSWPFSLRPVWFYQGNFDGNIAAVIYNGGNFVLFWAGIPAMIFCAIQAWRRQSLALLLVAVAFAFQWLPWTRIERAAFLYHYLTALPFIMLAVAYLAEDALRNRAWRRFAIGAGMTAVAIGVLLYPIASGLPMPSWYTQGFQALPPWNFYMQYPDPPQGDRALVSTGLGHLMLAAAVAALTALVALYGRERLERLRTPRGPAGPAEAVPESG